MTTKMMLTRPEYRPGSFPAAWREAICFLEASKGIPRYGDAAIDVLQAYVQLERWGYIRRRAWNQHYVGRK